MQRLLLRTRGHVRALEREMHADAAPHAVESLERVNDEADLERSLAPIAAKVHKLRARVEAHPELANDPTVLSTVRTARAHLAALLEREGHGAAAESPKFGAFEKEYQSFKGRGAFARSPRAPSPRKFSKADEDEDESPSADEDEGSISIPAPKSKAASPRYGSRYGSRSSEFSRFEKDSGFEKNNKNFLYKGHGTAPRSRYSMPAADMDEKEEDRPAAYKRPSKRPSFRSSRSRSMMPAGDAGEDEE
jgi:hypothetical protein